MERKPHANSVINSLPAKKRELLHDLLFEKNLALRAIANKSVKHFGVKIGYDSIRSYYHKHAQQHTLQKIAESTRSANAVVKAFADNPADTYKAILNLVGKVAFDKAMEKEEGKELDLRSIREITSLLIAARREDVHARRYALQREKWEIDVVRLCQQHHAEIQAISVDKSLDEDARMLAIQKRLFGPNPPQ